MILSDYSLRHSLETDWIGIDPLDLSQVQPASVDLKLDDSFAVSEDRYHSLMAGSIDMGNIKQDEFVCNPLRLKQECFTLYPQKFILASTLERVKVPNGIVGRVEGKSSLGRIGLLIHATAGYIDPGFEGQITLELYNLNSRPIILRAGLPVCQISFLAMDAPAEKPYGHEDLNSKYQNQDGATVSKYEG